MLWAGFLQGVQVLRLLARCRLVRWALLCRGPALQRPPVLGRCPERSYHLCAVAAEGPPQCGMPIPQPGVLTGSVAEVRVGLPMAWLAEPSAGPASCFRPCIGIQACVA